MVDLSIAVGAIPNRVVSDFEDFAPVRVVPDYAPNSCIQNVVDLLDCHTDEVGHDQSLQILGLMSLTMLPLQNVARSEADMSVDIVVDGTADKIKRVY